MIHAFRFGRPDTNRVLPNKYNAPIRRIAAANANIKRAPNKSVKKMKRMVEIPNEAKLAASWAEYTRASSFSGTKWVRLMHGDDVRKNRSLFWRRFIAVLLLLILEKSIIGRGWVP